MAEQKNLCYNCFQEREAPEGPCPYCGFDLAENEKKFPGALRAGTILNGRYIIGRVLGQGGFGITYLAWDTKLEARVAVKEFMPNEIATRVGTTVSVAVESRTEDFTYGAERFQEEARTLAKFMGQPNIAGVTDYFDENDTSYFVMDYIEGISFKTYIANHGGKVSVEEALNVMIPVLRALTAVHAEGFIHRDVTPDNIYITKDGMVKLLDFGSARYSIGDKSKSLDVILKVGYAPKEQYIHRSRQGPFTDVYSCAACFYAAITGFLPPEALERLEHDDLVPVSQCGIDIPEYLDKAILKGLAVQPEDRFQSAAEFLDAIESQQVVEVPVSGGNTASSAPEKKKVRPGLIAGLAAVVVVAIGIGIAIGGGGSSGGDGGSSITEALAPKVTIGGQAYSTALTELKLADQGLTDADIQDLGQLKNLQVLSLEDNPGITDLSPLAGLTELTALNLMGTGATDLTPISGLTGLEELDLANPDLADLSPLAGLTGLKILYLDDGNMVSSAITDLSPLAGLTDLEGLYIPAKSNYTDFSPLAGMVHLKELIMMGSQSDGTNSIDSLDFLTNLKDLERLRISVRSCDLSPIAGLTSLKEIRMNGDLYADSTAVFRDLTQLESLVLYMGNSSLCLTSDMSDFSGLTKLRSLHINVSGLESYTGLENLTELDELAISCNKGSSIRDLEPLRDLTQLRSLELYFDDGNPTVDISALSNLTELQSVMLSPSRIIADPSPISRVPHAELY